MLTITKKTGGVWYHGEVMVSKGYAKANTETDDFSFFAPNGQKPIATFNVSVITLVDETTDPTTTYPTFATVEALAEQLKTLGYVGFNEGGAAVEPSELLSTEPNNYSIIDATGKIFTPTPSGISAAVFLDGTYVSATDINNGQTSKWAISPSAIHADAGADRWVAGSASQERLIHMFPQGVNLSKIEYVNGTLTLAGSSTGVGAKETKVYAITSSGFFPSENYGVTDSNYTLVSDTTLLQYIQAHSLVRPTVPLSNVPSTIYGLVYDFLRNHQASGRIEMRRLAPYGFYV